MATHIAKIFMNGRSQAVRLPKDFRFDCDEVFVYKHDKGVLLTPKKSSWNDFFDQPSVFGDDFLNSREDSVPQDRDFF